MEDGVIVTSSMFSSGSTDLQIENHILIYREKNKTSKGSDILRIPEHEDKLLILLISKLEQTMAFRSMYVP
jgi:hypothetical protein